MEESDRGISRKSRCCHDSGEHHGYIVVFTSWDVRKPEMVTTIHGVHQHHQHPLPPSLAYMPTSLDTGKGIRTAFQRVTRLSHLGGISNQALCVGKGDVRRRGPVALVVGNDLDPVVLPYPHAAVRRPQVDADGHRRLVHAVGAVPLRGGR